MFYTVYSSLSECFVLFLIIIVLFICAIIATNLLCATMCIIIP